LSKRFSFPLQAANTKEISQLQRLLGMQQQLQRISLSASKQGDAVHAETPSIAELSDVFLHVRQQLGVDSDSHAVDKILTVQAANFQLFQKVSDLDECIGKRKKQLSELRQSEQVGFKYVVHLVTCD
jgi:hypothetical protein